MPNQNKLEKREAPKGLMSMESVSQWERDMERMFEDFWRRPFLAPWHLRHRLTSTIQAPPIDIYQDKDNVIVKAELPGLTKDDIEVNVVGSILTIKGEKRREKEVKEEDFYQSERSYGGFVRTVELPVDVKFDQADAKFKDGILEIKLPKTEEVKEKTKSIPIH